MHATQHILLQAYNMCVLWVFVGQTEVEGQIPVPVFINGVEAHTVVRHQFTGDHEQRQGAIGRLREAH